MDEQRTSAEDDRATASADSFEFRPRLPALASVESAGLGDVIKRVTTAIGIPACDGCRRRAETLNRLFPFGRPT